MARAKKTIKSSTESDLEAWHMFLISKAKDSSTYQLILREGKAEEAQDMLLLIGERRLGKPNASVTRSVRAINSIETLHAMAKRLFAVESWVELLAPPQ